MNIKEDNGKLERQKPIAELFHFPESDAARFTPSANPIRTTGGRKKKHYTAKEMRRRILRKTRREREQIENVQSILLEERHVKKRNRAAR